MLSTTTMPLLALAILSFSSSLYSVDCLNVLVTSVCIRSHFTSLVEPMREMVSRGHSVTLLLLGNCEEWASADWALGGEVAANVSIHQSAIDFDNLSVDPHDEASDAMYEFGERYEKAFPQSYQTVLDFLVDNNELSFDVIFCDVYSMGTMMVAEQKRIPLVVNNMLLPPIDDADFYGYNSWRVTSVKNVLQYLFGLRAICKPGTDKVMQLRTNLVLEGTYFTPFDYHLGFSILNQGGAAFAPSSSPAARTGRYFSCGYEMKKTKAVGDAKLKKWMDESEKPIVFVGMGSLTNIDYDEIESVINNAEQYPFKFVYSLNLKKIKHFQERNVQGYQDKNVHIVGEAEKLAIMKHPKVQIVTSQCDAKVALDTIAANKITICRPGFLHEFYVANLIESERLGVQIGSDLKFENLDKAIKRVQNNMKQLTDSVAKKSVALVAKGGVKESVDFIEKVHEAKMIYKPYAGYIWPYSYQIFYTHMPVLVAVFGGATFVLINAFLLFAFAYCSKSSESGRGRSVKPKSQ